MTTARSVSGGVPRLAVGGDAEAVGAAAEAGGRVEALGQRPQRLVAPGLADQRHAKRQHRPRIARLLQQRRPPRHLPCSPPRGKGLKI